MKIEDLKNTKIYMSNEADVIKFQDKIFNLGIIKMADGITHVSNPSLKDIFFTINNNLRVYVDFGKASFINNTRRQIFLKDVLSIEEPKCKFKPFDKVLVRSYDSCRWKPRLFARFNNSPAPEYKNDGLYETTDGCFYQQCIPYDEDLANTHQNPVL